MVAKLRKGKKRFDLGNGKNVTGGMVLVTVR